MACSSNEYVSGHMLVHSARAFISLSAGKVTVDCLQREGCIESSDALSADLQRNK